MPVLSNANLARQATPVWNGYAPAQGAKVVYEKFDFSVDSSIPIDLSREQRENTIEFVQTLWVDNSTNAATLTITLNNGQVLKLPPKSLAYLPVLSGQEFKAAFATTPAGGLIITVGLINSNIDPILWTVP